MCFRLNNVGTLKSWNLSDSIEIRNLRAMCAYAREQSRVREAKVPVLLSATALYMSVYTILWYPGPPVDVVMPRDREGNYRASCSAFLERGTRIRWNTSRVRRLSLFQFDRLIIIARVRVGDVTVGMSEMSKERGVIMARVIAKLKKINADVWCTFLGGNELNSSYSVYVRGCWWIKWVAWEEVRLVKSPLSLYRS